MTSILIIEDEDVIRNALRRLLERHGYQVSAARSVEQALTRHQPDSFELILADLRLPGAPGTQILEHAPSATTLIMTSYASVPSAVAAMQSGAYDYIAKPFDNDALLLALSRALNERRLKRRTAALKADVERDYPVSGMIGESPPMRQVFARINKVAATDTSVLILGESGTGKELVARALHEGSHRAEAPLVAVNCAAIPESLIEAELFGHERGAFTGAVNQREGLVEAASGGSLFLDEIGELPLAAQARLLRVLQEGEVRRLGSARSTRVDVRVLVATHRDLGAMVRAGAFREDLYFRINVVEISLPPLRERGEDIIRLAQHSLRRCCARLNRPPMRFHPEALVALSGYHWPGNVRELENVIERAVILADEDVLGSDAFGLSTSDGGTEAARDRPPSGLSLEAYFREFVQTHEHALTETELARQLGISRKSLWEKRHRLGIPRRPRR